MMANTTTPTGQAGRREAPPMAPKRAFLRKVVGLGLVVTGVAGLTVATGGAGGALAAVGALAAASHGGATLAGGLAAVSLLRKIRSHVRQVRNGLTELDGGKQHTPARELGD